MFKTLGDRSRQSLTDPTQKLLIWDTYRLIQIKTKAAHPRHLETDQDRSIGRQLIKDAWRQTKTMAALPRHLETDQDRPIQIYLSKTPTDRPKPIKSKGTHPRHLETDPSQTLKFFAHLFKVYKCFQTLKHSLKVFN